MGIGTAAGAVGPSQPAMDVETASNLTPAPVALRVETASQLVQ
jgi:hypothetical protein